MMTALKNAIQAKVRSKRGESITEVLVAIVVSGLAILMLATVIATAANVNRHSKDAMDAYYAANNRVVQSDVTVAGTITMTPASGGAAVSIAGQNGVAVSCSVGEQVDGTLVVSYVE